MGWEQEIKDYEEQTKQNVPDHLMSGILNKRLPKELKVGTGSVTGASSGNLSLTAANLQAAVIRGSKLEIDGSSDYIDVDTDLKLIAAAEECGLGRVKAGWHYPSDHKVGVMIAKAAAHM